MTNLRVGDEVVCIDIMPDLEWIFRLGPHYTEVLTRGKTYQVTKVVGPDKESDGWGIFLAEVTGGPWAVERFRKVKKIYKRANKTVYTKA